MRRLKIALAAGVLLGTVAVVITLSRSPLSVIRVNTAAHTLFATTTRRTVACQAGEALPRATSAIQLRLYAVTGPRVTAEVLAGGRVIAHGERASGWTGGAVTIPVAPLSTARSGVMLCFAIYLNGDETVEIMGEPASRALGGLGADGTLGGRVAVEYLRPGPSSWFSLAPTVARHMGLGHAASGTWSVFLVIALMGGLLLLCSRLLLRELGCEE
jgi:hypothetical protein